MTDEKDAPERKPTPGPRRVPPNPDVPKLRKKTEERVGPADEVSAAGYDALDEAKEKIASLQQRIEDGAITVSIEVNDTGVHFLKKI